VWIYQKRCELKNFLNEFLELNPSYTIAMPITFVDLTFIWPIGQFIIQFPTLAPYHPFPITKTFIDGNYKMLITLNKFYLALCLQMLFCALHGFAWTYPFAPYVV
jgi:hypothetical protein